MLENYTLEEKMNAFEKALESMDFKSQFADKLRQVVITMVEKFGDLKPINIARGLAHLTLLSSSQAQELSDRFFEILTEGSYKTSFERNFSRKLKESDIRRIVKKVLG